MEQGKPLEISVQATGVLPRKLALDAATILHGNERVEVMPSLKGIVLRAVWDMDAYLALDRLRELGFELEVSEPRVLYHDEGEWLEPIMLVVVAAPVEFLGDIVGDINRRRGMVQGIETDDERERISAIVPLAELIRYSNYLDDLTYRRATVGVEFFNYQPVPPGGGPDNEPFSAALRA